MSFEIPHKDDLATNSKLPGQLTENFKILEQEDHDDDKHLEDVDAKHTDAETKLDTKIGDVDAKHTDAETKLDTKIGDVDTKHDGNETKLDQKYSQITNQIIAKCNDLQEGEDKLDSDKASKVMLYKWWKELDDKFSACVDELDDKKASKKRVRENFQELSQLIQQFKDQITKQVDDDHQDLVNLVNGNFQKMNDKAERVALGTDMDTIRQAVMQVLQEQGVIKRDDPSVPDIKDPDKAASAAGEVAAVTSGEDSRAEAVRSALAGTD